MKMQFFTIPIRDPQRATDELNAFLASHRVVHTERQFVVDGANSLWSICISYVEGEARPASPGKRNQKVDYREILPEADFALFVKLRTLRKELADRDGVPVYTLFTNEQLAEMVRKRTSSLANLGNISGVGAARVEKYGEAFLRVLQEHASAVSPARTDSEVHETSNDSA
ncbi:MAG: HRDC domain-containing protein [Candidatus Binatia bacterium]